MIKYIKNKAQAIIGAIMQNKKLEEELVKIISEEITKSYLKGLKDGIAIGITMMIPPEPPKK